jgi:acetyl-CoA carboxylase carboxyltransferase component
VPKFTIIIGNSYGAGNYAMCGKAYDPRLIFSWPTAEMAVMSGASAAKTLLQIKVNAARAQGEPMTKEQEQEHLDHMIEKYNQQLSPYYAAARMWVDGVIDPMESRQVIAMGIEAANHAPIKEKFNVGVIQT